MSPVVRFKMTGHFYSGRNSHYNKFWTKWRNIKGCQGFKLQYFNCKCYFWPTLPHQKKVEFFFLELPLDILNHFNTIVSTKCGVNPAILQSLASTRLVFAPALQKTPRISEGKNSWKICKLDAAWRDKVGGRLLWSEFTIQFRSAPQ